MPKESQIQLSSLCLHIVIAEYIKSLQTTAVAAIDLFYLFIY